jgi:hypothetical protein
MDLKVPNIKEKSPGFESLSQQDSGAMEQKRLRAEFERLDKRGGREK